MFVLSWTLCHRCRRIQEACETKSPTSGKCKVFSNVLKLKMVRQLGQLLMLLLFTSCGVIIATTLLTDVNDRYAAQLLNSDNHQLDEVRLRSVSLKDFRRQLSQTRSYYDLLRIFFDRKSISDKEIDELLMAKTLKRISGHVHLREISASEDYPDEMYYDYGDYALQDPGTSVMEDTHRAYAHFEEMENSPLGYCYHPQPEIMPVRGEGDSKHKLYIPECTVLHRCRNVSGCCPNSSTTCGPKTIEVITKSFFVVELTDPDQVQPSNIQMVENLDFINHTECECKEIKGLPGCDQECPTHFTRMRSNMKCLCDCLDDNEICLEIKRGHKSLDEKTLMRIKDKTYMAPVCEEEVFDIKTGYCPRVHIRHEEHHYGHRTKHRDRNHRNQHERNHRRKNHKERRGKNS
ncbi:uncharacterized protein LOC135472647 isoform X2 [Liolophura sinensis]|uniref:uncharacterized protein LOC135472647 isoform X2 n=1 Tax=Liolophura sinensis TaxID=3198878 RepID=UPI0031588CEC